MVGGRYSDAPSLQVLSALLMQLIQTTPSTSVINLELFEKSEELAKIFIHEFFKRLTSQTEEKSIATKILTEFCTDLLAGLVIPEWPAAEPLLARLVPQLITLLKNHDTNAAFKNVSMDLLGTICAEFATHKKLQVECRLDCKACEEWFRNGQEVHLVGKQQQQQTCHVCHARIHAQQLLEQYASSQIGSSPV